MRRTTPTQLVATSLILGTICVSVIGFALSVERSSYDIWAAFWVAPMLLILSIPIAASAARAADDHTIGQIVMLGAVVKVVGGSIGRYASELALYGGSDADSYDAAGKLLAPAFREGVYQDLGKVSGTRFTEIITGQVYALIGPSRLGGFLVFSWLGFVGVCLFWHAFRIALPDGDHRRYLLLVLFFPTMLFWTSGTGKDAWMILCIGGAAYGFARLITGHLRGIPFIALGLWGAAVMRPHIPLIFVVSAGIALPVALLARRQIGGRNLQRRGGTAVLVVILAFAAVLVAAQAEVFFELDRLDAESAEELSERVEFNTQTGGSAFDAPDPSTPWGFMAAFATVLFRPFLFEADNAQTVATAIEGTLLIVLVIGSWGRLRRLPRMLLTSPYLVFALSYTFAFVYAFASLENFGILARQRSQVLPVAFVLLCFVRSPRREDKDGSSVRAPSPARLPGSRSAVLDGDAVGARPSSPLRQR